MRFSPRVDRLAGPGAEAWDVHIAAARRRDAGEDVIFLTVGDPDQLPPEAVIAATVEALRRNRTGYAPILGYPSARGDRGALPAAARPALLGRERRHSARRPGRAVLRAASLAGPGDEIIVPEPADATYEAVVGATGARMVSVPLDPGAAFTPISRHLPPR